MTLRDALPDTVETPRLVLRVPEKTGFILVEPATGMVMRHLFRPIHLMEWSVS